MTPPPGGNTQKICGSYLTTVAKADADAVELVQSAVVQSAVVQKAVVQSAVVQKAVVKNAIQKNTQKEKINVVGDSHVTSDLSAF